MATIKLKKSSVAGRIPNASDLAYGEVALNFADGKIYYKNSSNDIKGFVDSDGVQSAITGALANLTTSDIPEGSNLYYTNARFDSALGSSSSISSIRGYFSAGGDLSYNSSTGEFSFDVENVYTQSNFDSDFNTSLDAAALGGTGLTYVGTTNTLNITNTGVVGQGYGDSSRIPVFTVNDQGQLTYAKEVRYPGVSSLGYDSANGQVTIGTIDSQTFAATVTLDPFTTTDLTEGNNLYYTKARFDSDINFVTGAPGGLEFTDSGELQIRASGVVAGTYGSASQIPVIRITNQGRIDSAGTIAVAGVSSTSFDSAGFTFSVNTADGGTYSEMVHTKMPGTAGTYGSASQVPIITVNEFGHVDSVSTTSVAGVSSTAFDSASFNFSINTADGGTYTDMVHTKMPGTAGTYGSASQVPVITVNEFGHVDSVSTTSVAGVSSTSWDSASGVLTINTSDGASYSERILEQELGPNDDVSFKSVQLYTADSHLPYSEGLVWYDTLHKTVNYYSDDSNVVHELGIEEHQRVYNNTGATILKGQPLYFSGNYVDPNGTGVPTVGKADATDVNAYNAQGLAASDIADGEYGFCIIAGQLHDIDTSHLNAGTNFFVGLGAGLTQNASPTYPNYPMCLGWVVRSDSSEGILLVNQQNHSVRSFRVQTSAHIGTDLQVDGNLTVLGSQVIASSENISIGGAFNYLNAGDTIGEANTNFVGSGLDDAYFAGHYNGDSASKQFYVKIDATGTPDTFEWGHDSASPVATGIAITGSEQDLTLGIKINFGTTTGHTSGDKWTGSASPTNVDTGWVSNRNTGTSGIGYTHLGVFYDVTDNAFKFFDRYDPEPSGTINTADSTFALATISAGTFDGNLAWANITNKPDPTVTFNMTGEVTGTGSTTLTDLASGTISVTSTIDPTLDLTLQSLSVTDLTVTGTQTITNTETLSTGAANIFLNDSQISEPDMGLFVGYNDSYWGGIFRDATDNKWKIFNDYTPNLESSGTVDISDSSFTLATLQVGTLQGDLDWSYIQNKPDPQVTVTLTGEVTGSGTGTLTDLGNGTVSLATSIDPSANVVLNNLDITGDLNVYGTTTTVEQTNLAVSDSKIFLADKNPGDAIDVALLFEYNDGVDSQHSGLFRDASDGKFKFFKTYTDSIGNTINIADSSFALATVVADRFEGDFVGDITGSYAGFDSDFAAKSTTDLTEGTNLYYTQARADSDARNAISASGDLTYNPITGVMSIDVEQVYTKANFDSDLGDASTTNLPEGTNLYYTTARADSDFDVRLAAKSTTDLTEGTNLYYTQARVDSDITALVDSSFVSSLQAATEINALTDGYYDSTNEILSLGYGSLGLGASDNATCIGRWNTSFGIEAGHSCAANTGNSGSCNTSIGYHAGRCQSSNTWMGTYVGYKAGCAAGNYASTYIGMMAGVNGSGAYNTIIGASAGCAATGGWNTSVGAYSMTSISTSFAYNTSLGYQAARFLDTGCSNVAIGVCAMYCGSNSSYNVYMGDQAGKCQNASYNIGIGQQSLYYAEANYNVGVGRSSLRLNTTGCYNVAIGDWALQCNSTGICNTAVGSRAGNYTKGGSCNSYFGMDAGYNTTGSENTAVGYKALYCNCAGSCNVAVGACAAYTLGGTGCQIVAIGFQALRCNTNGRWNTAVGHCALSSNINNDRNVAVGSYAGQNNTTGNYNITVGHNAGRFNTTGRCNTAVGNGALYSSGCGGCSVAIGYLALYSNTIGDGNTSLGFCSARENTTGGCNVAVGYCAGVNGTTTRYNVALGACSMIGTNGDFNIGIGYETFCASGGTGGRNVGVGAWSTTAITSAYYNTAIGICSNKNVTTGYGNTALGTWTLTGNTTGAHNTASGYQSMVSHSGSCNVAAGYQSMQNSGEGSCNVALGARAGTCISTGFANTIMGYHAFDNATAASNNVVIGDSAGTILLDSNDNNNVIIGSCALSNSAYLDSASLDIVNNVVIGALAGRCMAKGCNVAIGYSAYSNNVTGCRSTVVGFCAMTCATTGRDNVAIGYKALDQWTGECNTAIGSNSMRFSAETGTVMGICNTALGSGAAYCMQDGCRNTFIGANSGWIASSRGGAYANTFIGGGSGWRVNGDFNAGIGWEAGLNLDSGACNTLLGTTAGYGLTTGSLNTFAGAFTGCSITTGTNNILIGANVGKSTGSFALDLDSATSNAIVIGNNGSKSFDIYNLSFNIDSNGETNAIDFNTTSDLSLKDNIEAINNGIDIVNKINPVSFNWKSSGKKAYGVIAQEIEEVIPEIVSKNSKGNKTVSYSQIIAFLVDAVKQQQKDIEELKSKIK